MFRIGKGLAHELRPGGLAVAHDQAAVRLAREHGCAIR